MKLSIVIVNYNVRIFLENALLSVCKAVAGIDAEIFVVDNASDDGSVDMLRQKFPQVKLIANEKNVGFAAANNQAIEQSTGEYLLLLNPDTLLQENTLQVMIEFMGDHPGVGLAGCKILNPDGTLQLPCRRSFPTPWVAFTKIVGLSALFPQSKLFGKYNLTFLSPEESYSVDAVSGSFMFVRRSAIAEVGGLDEQFFMYGEDLDWCYRIAQAGWEIWYVHTTQIIHYKGESARRSDIDEVKHFYEAMRVFVRKHLRRGMFADLVLGAGIALRHLIAFANKVSRPLRAALLDYLIVTLSLFLGMFIWFGAFFHFPPYAYPIVLVIPGITQVASLYSLGVYTRRKFSIMHTAGAVIVAFLILSALTFFFKQYAFSRMVIAISALITFISLPAWRIGLRLFSGSSAHHSGSLFGRRTLIVGADTLGVELLRKLRTRITDGYEVVGFVDLTRKRVGEKVSGVEILGSIDNIGKVLEEQNASEVIFSAETLSYTDILSIISRSRNRTINFRLVPSSRDVIIGKAHIDELEDIPLVDIDYNIDRASNRLMKRLFDIACSTVALILFYPFAILQHKSDGEAGRVSGKILSMPKVFHGDMSIVGPPVSSSPTLKVGSSGMPLYWGKPGLTGLVQINYHEELQPQEIEQYNLYYAKNQSLALDIEILLKSMIIYLKH